MIDILIFAVIFFVLCIFTLLILGIIYIIKNDVKGDGKGSDTNFPTFYN